MTTTIAPASPDTTSQQFAEQIERQHPDLANAIKTAKYIEVFTGAGMSADSGLDTFRDANTGIWSNVDPQAMASLGAWAKDPEPMLAWYLWRGTLCRRAEPHPGHLAVGAWQKHLENQGDNLHVTTQNIDDLHERAGVSKASHLHGSLFAYRCSICSKPAATPELPDEQIHRATPPACGLCGNPVRPGVVWFGEPLPEKDWFSAELSMQKADLVVIIGTSGVVYPAAALPEVARRKGTPIIEISPASSDLSSMSDWSLRTTAAVGAPAVAALAGVEI